jgi:hypothetical protein
MAKKPTSRDALCKQIVANNTALVEAAIRAGRNLAVAIDSNCYGPPNDVVLDPPAVKQLRRIVNKEAVKVSDNEAFRVLEPEAWGYEMVLHLKTSISRWATEAKSTNLKAGKLIKNAELSKKIGEVKKKLGEYEQAAYEHAKLLWEDHRKSLNAHPISAPNDSAAKILQLYAQCLPPFTGKKRGEFPDAYSLLALERYAEESGRLVMLATDDDACRAYCEGNLNLLAFQSLQSIVDLLDTRDDALKLHDKSKEISNLLRNSSSCLTKNVVEPLEAKLNAGILCKLPCLDGYQRRLNLKIENIEFFPLGDSEQIAEVCALSRFIDFSLGARLDLSGHVEVRVKINGAAGAFHRVDVKRQSLNVALNVQLNILPGASLDERPMGCEVDPHRDHLLTELQMDKLPADWVSDPIA